MNIRFNRVILFVHDVDRFKKFYQENFQFKLAEEISFEWVVLRNGEIEIALHKIGDAYAIPSGASFKTGRNVKLVFEIDEDIFQLRQNLIGKEVAMREIKSFPGSSYIICDSEDPEGNVFQLKQNVHA